MADLLYWMHLASIALGGAAAFGIPVVGSMMGAATPEARPVLLQVAGRLSRVGHMALALLLITGPLALVVSGMRLGGLPHWFWVKMLLVGTLIVLVFLAVRNTKRVVSGDADAMARAPKIGMGILVGYLLVIAMAVLTFH